MEGVKSNKTVEGGAAQSLLLSFSIFTL
ncbi:hypothetical protein A2U01_0037628, partial [Trifolium medium]|nr:hypothetical protein [Trifolium medium]